MVKNRIIIALFYVLVLGTAGFAQGITTASSYFKSISDYYATLSDYEADVEIVADKQRMEAHVSFKKPNLLRLDFSNPQEQVIVFNGDMLTIYLPGAAAVLQQSVQSDGSANGANLATPQGLSLLSRYYTVAYEVGPEPVILEEGSDEWVVKLILTRRNASESFRSIKIAVSSDTKLIRRIEALTTKAETFSFDFLEYGLNQNISDQRFLYDAPSSANNYNNFLFTE